jgi:hypothetical protein
MAAEAEPRLKKSGPLIEKDNDPTIFKSRQRRTDLHAQVIQNSPNTFVGEIKAGYAADKLFSKVLEKPKAHPAFKIKNNLIWTKNRGGEDRNSVTCVRYVKHLGGTLKLPLDYCTYYWEQLVHGSPLEWTLLDLSWR